MNNDIHRKSTNYAHCPQGYPQDYMSFTSFPIVFPTLSTRLHLILFLNCAYIVEGLVNNCQFSPKFGSTVRYKSDVLPLI